MTTPPPSWEVFLACKRCGAPAGLPCQDMRGTPKGYVRARGKDSYPMRSPHRGRKRVAKGSK